ncbi:MAG TPA: hypothetical protein VHE30_28605 [Polyangiaceae bacterium]|nr:hypothetical protein [Polyangiaceae bacterium]
MLSVLRCARVRLSVSALLSVFWASSPAFGWVEKTVTSDSVTVDVERDGSAVVSHEILLALRGGPLPEIVVEPVDQDAALLPEATATSAKSGVAAGYPLPLSATKDGDKVRLHVLEGKGLRSGSYQLRFSYRTNLLAGGHVTPGTEMTRVEWHGLAFSNGMDAAKVVFRVPRGNLPPRLRAKAGTDPSSDIADDGAGVFLSTLRRGDERDELEVVRPHVAKSESVAWSVVVDRGTFDAGAEPEASIPEAPAAVIAAPKAAPPRRPPPRSLVFLAAAVALLAVLVLVVKDRGLARLGAERRVSPRPLLPAPLALRGLCAALSIPGAAVLVAAFSEPELALGVFLLGLVAQTYLPPAATPVLRGPGKWERRDPDFAFDDAPPRLGALRFVDAGHPFGFVLFVSLLAATVAGALVAMRSSTFHGVAAALASTALFPVFFTGRSAELPPDPTRTPVRILEWLHDMLARDARLDVAPFVRLPLGQTRHDEIRLLVLPRQAVPGLVGIEVGVEYRAFPLGHVGLPFVLVRVREGSPAEDALPKGHLWTRGRTPDERVAALRPRFFARRALLALVRETASAFGVPEENRRQPGKSAPRSGGSSARAEKPRTTSSPAHAT